MKIVAVLSKGWRKLACVVLTLALFGMPAFNVLGAVGYVDAGLNIINQGSDLTVGDIWTTYFQTSGQSDLTISAASGTHFGADISLEGIYCGNEKVSEKSINTDGDAITVANYSCNSSRSKIQVRAVSSGRHWLSFDFGGTIGARSHNFACNTGTLNDTCTITASNTMGAGDTISGSGSLIIASGGALTTAAGDRFNINLSSVTIQSGGTITGNFFATTSTFTINVGGSINVNEKGYANTYGPGGGTTVNFAGTGGGHGGAGGRSLRSGLYGNGGPANDSLTQPVDFGSGGGNSFEYPGKNGGGSVKLNVSGTLTINGSILANGGANSVGINVSGGGAGGSIWINAGTLQGSGSLSANGGNAAIYDSVTYGGAGGGGRISVNKPLGSIVATVSPGVSIGSAATGTIYVSPAIVDGQGLARGLVGWWSMDAASLITNIGDTSPNGNNSGYLSGFGATSTVVVPGKVNQALKFTGSPAYVSGPSYNGVQSISFWTKPEKTTQEILSLSGSASVSLSSGTVTLTGFTGTVYVDSTATAVLPDSGWHLVTINTAAPVNASAIQLGKTPFGFYRGLLDDVRIYQRTLQSSDITGLRNFGQLIVHRSSTDKLGMQAWWTMDGANISGSTILDSSNHGYTPSLQGDPLPSVVRAVNVEGLQFDGSNNFALIPIKPLSSLSGPNSICAWANITDASANGSGAWNQTLLNLRLDGNNGVRITNDYASNGDLVVSYLLNGVYYGLKTTSPAFKSSSWVHICYVWNGSSLALYVNGAAAAGSASSVAIGEVSAVGAMDDLYTGQWQGIIDDVRIYSFALSTFDIHEIITQGGSLVRTPTKSTQLNSGLVGWWTFDGKDTNWATGNTKNKAANGNDGNMVGMATTTSPAPGRLGQALKFDGLDDYVVTATLNGSSLTTVSYSLWFKTTQPGTGYLLRWGNVFCVLSSGKVSCTADGSTSGSTITLNNVNNGKWHHLAYIVNGNSQSLYIDGVAQTPATETLSAPNDPVNIGRSTTTSDLFNGAIDDVRILSRVLGSTEVRQLYTMGMR